MNCKQGDLAIVLYSNWGNEGKIVRCLSWSVGVSGKRGWHVDQALNGPVIGILDENLRPILPDDETWQAFKTQFLTPDPSVIVQREKVLK